MGGLGYKCGVKPPWPHPPADLSLPSCPAHTPSQCFTLGVPGTGLQRETLALLSLLWLFKDLQLVSIHYIFLIELHVCFIPL